MHDAVRESFAVTAEEVLRFVDLSGDERVLVSGGDDLASALAPHVGEVTQVETVRLTELPYELGAFDLAAAVGALHHVRRPELAVAELARVTRLGGRVLVADRLALIDPLRAIEFDRLERERDPMHERFLPDTDMRSLFDSNGLVLLHSEVESGAGWYLLRR